MRGCLILLWAAAIFVFTCTASFTELLEWGTIRFQWNGNPQLSELLLPLPEHINEGFLRQKIGHIGAFWILTILLQAKYLSRKFVLLIALFYSGLTEILQLFFMRDGRLFDMGFDTVGILLALGAGTIFSIRKPKGNEIMEKSQP